MILASLVLALAQYPHTFAFEAPSSAKSVALVGTFNSWDHAANPMVRALSSNEWTVTVELSPGSYQYKFLIDDSQWVLDPKNPKVIDDGNGNKNSALEVLPPDYASPASLGDGEITRIALYSDQTLPYLNYDRGNLSLEMRLRPNDVQQVDVIFPGKGSKQLHLVSADDLYQYDSVEIPWNGHSLLRYAFKLIDGTATLYYGANGPSSLENLQWFSVDSGSYQPFVTPDWVPNTVVYQIFPDRFDDGDTSNDPPGAPSWAETTKYANWLGGDLQGVDDKVSYLSNLGIGCIYFNPVFQTTAYHGYETVDYLKIDPHFGDNSLFAKLTSDLSKQGIRTVLDGVFNHTSTLAKPFVEAEASGQASKYWNWYTFEGFPVVQRPKPNYVAWDGYASMPKLRNSNPEVQSYLLNVPKFWNDNAHVDGWRLDAANEIPMSFWKTFRKRVKAINPKDWIVGEYWGDAAPWLKGDMWDGVMNYQFLFAVTNFVKPGGDSTTSHLWSKLANLLATYPPQANRAMMNLLDSHDTPRILTVCGGDPTLRNLAAAIEFSWIGAPTIYYGDEIGMEGGADPDDRRPMNWGAATDSNPTLQFYKKLIRIRSSSVELREGDPFEVLCNDAKGELVFGRRLQNSASFCAINRSSQSESIDIPVKEFSATKAYTDGISGITYLVENGRIQVQLGPDQAAILAPAPELRSSNFLGGLPHAS